MSLTCCWWWCGARKSVYHDTDLLDTFFDAGGNNNFAVVACLVVSWWLWSTQYLPTFDAVHIVSFLSRRSRQWERLRATGVSICSSVCLFVCLSVCRQIANTRFSQKLSNLEPWCWRPIGSRTSPFQRTHYWTPKIQDGWDPPSWKSTWRHFFCWG